MYLFLTAMIALDMQDLHAAEDYTTNTGDILTTNELSLPGLSCLYNEILEVFSP